MVVRLALLALVASALVASAGCFGPQNDRLYVSEWKAKRTKPFKLRKDWEYHGEHWEDAEWVDETK